MKEKISSCIDWLMTLIYSVIIILTITMVLLRYLFGTSLIGGSELSRFLFVFSNCLGTGVLLERNEHIKVDIVLNLMPNIIKKIILIINSLIIVMLHGYLLYLTIDWMEKTGMNLSDFFRIPMKYVQICLPIGFVLVIFYALNNVFNIILNRK